MKQLLLCTSFLFTCICLCAQSILYEFAAPNAAHHEAEISITATKLPAGPAYFRMSRSSPGRYATHEYGKNVYNVKAYDAGGKTLLTEKADADVYKVNGHGGTVKLTYTLFANYADGTYANVDLAGYHLNMPATFMWVKGMDKAPITFRFTLRDKSWKIATQLKPTDDPLTFTAPGLQYMMDSPVKIGTLHMLEWKATNPDKKEYTLRLALEAETTDELAAGFARKVERVVNQAKAVFGELPAFDFGTYTFLASINPYVQGDGMEHRNSTMITTPGSFDGGDRLLGVFAHEFFHCWNVERIRPHQLEPFNFEKSNMSDGLWVAEGFTQYYGSLILKRAGFTSEGEFLAGMSGLINTKMNQPGAQDYSPIENSQRAVYVDAGVSIDRTNYQNMYASYYTYGGAIALALDLDLRRQFPGVSLDTYMRELWQRFGKTEKPYTVTALQDALAAITNNDYASAFFSKYVFGHEAFDYQNALAPAGLQLSGSGPQAAWAGPIGFTTAQEEMKLASGTVKNTPWYNTGIDVGDVLESIDGKKLSDRKDLEVIMAAHKPGDKLTIVYKHRGKPVVAQLVLTTNPAVKITPIQTFIPDKKTGGFRLDWLGDKTSGESPKSSR